jgi:predicted CopG family antitoxin
MAQDLTTIQISKEARDRLKELGKMGETYDDVIKKLIKQAKECEKK